MYTTFTKPLLLIIFCCFAFIVGAQTVAPADSAKPVVSNVAESFTNYLKNKKGSVSLVDSLFATQTLLEIEKNNYLRTALVHRRNTFDWQYRSGIIIFYMVMFIVFVGLIISGLHFYKSLNPPKKRKAAVEEVAEVQSELEVSLTGGIKLRSSLIGLMILVISLAFMYLYLIYVYPVDELLQDKNVTNVIQG